MTVAAMSVALKMADDEEGYIGRSFLKAFKDNWKQGTVLWLITVAASYAIYLDFQFFEALEGNPILFLIIGIASTVLAVSALLYSYPLIARYENNLFRTINNSIDITRKYMGRTLLLSAILIVEFILFQFTLRKLRPIYPSSSSAILSATDIAATVDAPTVIRGILNMIHRKFNLITSKSFDRNRYRGLSTLKNFIIVNTFHLKIIGFTR